MSHTPTNNPNTLFEDTINGISILTSFDPSYNQGGNEFGVGSLKPRSIAASMALYKPYNNTFDTLVQLMAGFEIATKYVHEWKQDDEFWADEGMLTPTPPANAAVVNNQSGVTPYVPAVSGVYYILDATDAAYFRAGDTVRYGYTSGGEQHYAYAVIEKIGSVNTLLGIVYADNATTQALLLRSVDYNSGIDAAASVLPKATAATTVLERMFSVRGSDRSFSIQPRGNLPKMYKTYIQTAALDTAITQRAMRDESFIDEVARKQMQLMAEMRRGRELLHWYSKGGKFDIPANVDYGTETDKAYLADGIWKQVDDFNSIQFDTTSATTVRASCRTFDEHVYGAESGGPFIRQGFASGRYVSQIEAAFEDQKRFYGVEYVAGVRVSRRESTLGYTDYVYCPLLDFKHPFPDGSLRTGTGRGVMLLCSVPDNFVRIEYTGEGPRMHSFVEKGGQKEEIMRIEVSAGLRMVLKQYTATHVEA